MDANVVSWTGPANGARQHLVLCRCVVQLRSAREPFCAPEPAQNPNSRRGRITKELLEAMHVLYVAFCWSSELCLQTLHDVRLPFCGVTSDAAACQCCIYSLAGSIQNPHTPIWHEKTFVLCLLDSIIFLTCSASLQMQGWTLSTCMCCILCGPSSPDGPYSAQHGGMIQKRTTHAVRRSATNLCHRNSLKAEESLNNNQAG